MLFVSDRADHSGPTHSLLLLLHHLRGRLDVCVLVPGDGWLCDQLAAEGIPVRRLATLGKRGILAVVRLVRSEAIDLVYGNGTSRAYRHALIAARFAGAPFICHIREMADGTDWRKFAILRGADALVAVSEASAHAFHRRWGGPKPHVVHNGVEVPAPPLDREGCRKWLSDAAEVPPAARLMVNVGHLSPRKGQEAAIRTLAAVVTRQPAARLLLVGHLRKDPAFVGSLRRLAEELGVTAHIRFLGFREEVAGILRAADVMVHTARRDPHPRAVLEAMAAGLPVVAFAVDGVQESVQHGRTGYLIAPGDLDDMASRVATLLSSETLRAAMGREAMDQARRLFSAPAAARRVERIVRSVLAARQPRGAARR